MTVKMLVIYSDPGDGERLRLDREDRMIGQLSRRHSEKVEIERLHASQINDIYEVILESDFEYIHFSGHGNEGGIYLDKAGVNTGGELVGINRLQNILSIASRPPLLVVVLSCYSNESLDEISQIAPFVVSGVGPIDDELCIEFSGSFYERLFAGYSISKAFDDACNILSSKELSPMPLQLSRRQLIRKGESAFVESTPLPHHDSILINVDLLSEKISRLKLQEEMVYELVAKKLAVHYWIFAVPRDRCIIPIGKSLFGEFNWTDASDVVNCTNIIRLSSGVPNEHWQCWSKLLIAYNDLASCEYRILPNPGDPTSRSSVRKAISLLRHYVTRYLIPARAKIAELGFESCLPNVEFMIAHADMALDQYELERYPQAVKNLEEALTNFHEIVDAIQPPEDVDV